MKTKNLILMFGIVILLVGSMMIASAKTKCSGNVLKEKVEGGLFGSWETKKDCSEIPPHIECYNSDNNERKYDYICVEKSNDVAYCVKEDTPEANACGESQKCVPRDGCYTFSEFYKEDENFGCCDGNTYTCEKKDGCNAIEFCEDKRGYQDPLDGIMACQYSEFSSFCGCFDSGNSVDSGCFEYVKDENTCNKKSGCEWKCLSREEIKEITIDPYFDSSTEFQGKEYRDTCQGNSVIEFFRSEDSECNGLQALRIECPEGKICSGGECVDADDSNKKGVFDKGEQFNPYIIPTRYNGLFKDDFKTVCKCTWTLVNHDRDKGKYYSDTYSKIVSEPMTATEVIGKSSYIKDEYGSCHLTKWWGGSTCAPTVTHENLRAQKLKGAPREKVEFERVGPGICEYKGVDFECPVFKAGSDICKPKIENVNPYGSWTYSGKNSPIGYYIDENTKERVEVMYDDVFDVEGCTGQDLVYSGDSYYGRGEGLTICDSGSNKKGEDCESDLETASFEECEDVEITLDESDKIYERGHIQKMNPDPSEVDDSWNNYVYNGQDYYYKDNVNLKGAIPREDISFYGESTIFEKNENIQAQKDNELNKDNYESKSFNELYEIDSDLIVSTGETAKETAGGDTLEEAIANALISAIKLHETSVYSEAARYLENVEGGDYAESANILESDTIQHSENYIKSYEVTYTESPEEEGGEYYAEVEVEFGKPAQECEERDLHLPKKSDLEEPLTLVPKDIENPLGETEYDLLSAYDSNNFCIVEEEEDDEEDQFDERDYLNYRDGAYDNYRNNPDDWTNYLAYRSKEYEGPKQKQIERYNIKDKYKESEDGDFLCPKSYDSGIPYELPCENFLASKFSNVYKFFLFEPVNKGIDMMLSFNYDAIGEKQWAFDNPYYKEDLDTQIKSEIEEPVGHEETVNKEKELPEYGHASNILSQDVYGDLNTYKAKEKGEVIGYVNYGDERGHLKVYKGYEPEGFEGFGSYEEGL